MPKSVPLSLEALTAKLAQLALVAPDEFHAFEVLVEAALKRHQEEDRAKRLAAFSRVK